MAPSKITVRDVAPAHFIAAYALHLKKSGQIKLPPWVDYAKTSLAKELAPSDSEWYYIRAASVARKIYLRQGMGIGALRKIYGAPKRAGPKRTHFVLGSGSLARSILSNFERMGLLEKRIEGGRKLTSHGLHELDLIAESVHSTLGY